MSTAVTWVSESITRERYPATGSQVVQLTSSPAISNNIYCEQPYCTADGRRLIFNSDRTGVPQVFAASVPDGLLESLDET